MHQSIKANFLMSPPLVVAFALAGRVDIDLLGRAARAGPGRAAGLPARPLAHARGDPRPDAGRAQARGLPPGSTGISRRRIRSGTRSLRLPGTVYAWDAASTYIQEPPFFADFPLQPAAIAPIKGARSLGIFGDSVTTDHISPAGAIKKASPAGRFLLEHGVAFEDFNSYGSRRGNDRVMTRGTFANVRIKNLMLGGEEGGTTLYFGPGGDDRAPGKKMSIFDAAMRYQADGVPLLVIAGQEYGTGSSRDWAAKGTSLLGVKAVVATSFERIHRSNLVGMGVLPLQFKEGTNARTLGLDGTETFSLSGLDQDLAPRQDVTLQIVRRDGTRDAVPVRCRIDTPVEVEYYQHGGILAYVLRQIFAKNRR